MSYRLTDAAWQISDPIAAADMHVLQAMAFRACNACGFAWPGVEDLMRLTRLGATSIRAALKRLEQAGLLRVHAFGSGGRGRATEYIVMPGFPKLSTAPCGNCQNRRVNPSRGDGYVKARTPKPTATRGVSAKPTAKAPLNPPPGEAASESAIALQPNNNQRKNDPENGGQQISVTNRSGLASSPSGPQPSASGAAMPPLSEPHIPAPPRNATEALQAINAMVSDIGATLTLQSPATDTGDGKAKRTEGETARQMPESEPEAVKRED